jgi:hypothetical protein
MTKEERQILIDTGIQSIRFSRNFYISTGQFLKAYNTILEEALFKYESLTQTNE